MSACSSACPSEGFSAVAVCVSSSAASEACLAAHSYPLGHRHWNNQFGLIWKLAEPLTAVGSQPSNASQES